MIRYTLHFLQPDGSHRVHATGDGPGIDLTTPALPDAILRALGALYGGGWWLSAMWSGGWRVRTQDRDDRSGRRRPDEVDVGYIDYGPTPPEPHPDQASLFGGGS